jgi:molecular chaperone GrpE (heat shock protein)
MDDGSQARTRGEDRPPRPGGPDDEQPFSDPGGVAGQGDAPHARPAADEQNAGGAQNTGAQNTGGDGQPTSEIDGGQAGDPGGDELVRSAEVERDEYLDALRRLQADFENYRKRVAKQQLEEADRAARSLVDKLLPVLDVLDLAAAHLGDPASDDGRALVQATALLNDVLTKEGLERIDPLGEPFDPSLHEAVGQVPAETGPGQPVGSPAVAPEPSATVAHGPGRDDPTGNVSASTHGVDDTEGVTVTGGTGTGGPGGAASADTGTGGADGGGPGSPDAGSPDAGGDGGHEVVVAQVMRAGYRWKGAVVRPAMVMVRG